MLSSSIKSIKAHQLGHCHHLAGIAVGFDTQATVQGLTNISLFVILRDISICLLLDLGTY